MLLWFFNSSRSARSQLNGSILSRIDPFLSKFIGKSLVDRDPSILAIEVISLAPTNELKSIAVNPAIAPNNVTIVTLFLIFDRYISRANSIWIAANHELLATGSGINTRNLTAADFSPMIL
jgi:hypothetical protein